jgi:predicted DNA-binding helix-hairpin-helix protein
MVVGAADETDRDIFGRIDQLYTDWNLKRVYYSAFRPVRHIPLEEHPATPPMREHRLYQMDWLKRIYQFSNQELGLAFDRSGFLSLEQDPKTAIAVENLEAFPVDVNAASREQLLRVPGVGPTSVQRILENRRQHKIDTWRDLQAMGVARTRAWPFLAFPGQRPPPGKQLRLELFGEDARQKQRQELQPAAAPMPARPGAAGAPCGQASSCTGCAMYGAPGHPGPSKKP